MAELFSVAAKPRLPSAARVRMPARRAWNVPQSDADAISRYFCCPGSHARRQRQHPVGQPEPLQHRLGVRDQQLQLLP